MWTNWSGGQSCRPSATVRPLDEAGVAGVVRRAAERGQTVRPVGSGHAFSALAVTDDVHVDCSAFSGVTGVHARRGGRTSVRVRAGTTLDELHTELDARDLALAVPLENGAPTVGGALACGMHGSGVGMTSLSEQVLAMRIVDGRGRVRDVAPDDLDAARTSLGALGVIVDVELAVVPAAPVTVTRAPRPVDEVLDPALWDAHAVVEAALFPSARTALLRWADPLPAARAAELVGAGGGPVPLTGELLIADAVEAASSGRGTSKPAPEPAPEPGKERSVGVTSAGAGARTALGGALVAERALPRLVPRLNRVVSRLARTVTATGAMHRVLSSPPAVRYEQTEWALPREALADAVREVLARLSGDLEPGLPVRMRLGGAENGWLHPAYGRATGWIAVRAPRGTDPGPVLGAASEVLAAHGGRPHWGSRHDLVAADVLALYPRAADFLRVRDDYDPDRVFANPALESLLGS